MTIGQCQACGGIGSHRSYCNYKSQPVGDVRSPYAKAPITTETAKVPEKATLGVYPARGPGPCTVGGTFMQGLSGLKGARLQFYTKEVTSRLAVGERVEEAFSLYANELGIDMSRELFYKEVMKEPGHTSYLNVKKDFIVRDGALYITMYR